MIRRPPRSTPLSLHDALPISRSAGRPAVVDGVHPPGGSGAPGREGRVREKARGAREGADPEGRRRSRRSEEHTSELQSQSNLVCRLLLEKKKSNNCTSSYDYR